MYSAFVEDFLDWRRQAREFLQAKARPEDIQWLDQEQESLFHELRERPVASADSGEIQFSESPVLIHPDFLKRALYVSHTRDPEKWNVLYRVLWKYVHQTKMILEDPADPDVMKWHRIEKNLARDIHKMHAFVRFRKLEIPWPEKTASTQKMESAENTENAETDAEKSATALFIAWYEPDHLILKLATPFFARRFGQMNWMIATPEGVAHYDQKKLEFSGPPTSEERARISALADGWEEIWLSYYAHIFNPARLKISAMKNEMPVRFWKNLPEAKLIPELIRKATSRVDSMHTKLSGKDELSARDFIPRSSDLDERADAKTRPEAAASTLERSLEHLLTPSLERSLPPSLAELKEAARGCRGCELFETATQTVFGEGNPHARVMVVGEQPGDIEDQIGRPFMGPAGQVLRATLDQLGILDDEIYFTNAVKHFRFQNVARAAAKRRIHDRPAVHHMRACHGWLEEEVDRIRPDLIVCLGSTTAHAVVGYPLSILKVRGTFFESSLAEKVLVTYHPSYLLRVADEELKQQAVENFKADLSLILPFLKK